MSEQARAAADPTVTGVREIRAFDGTPAEFWPACVEALTRAAGATFGMILLLPRSPDPAAAGEDDAGVGWRRIAAWPGKGRAPRGIGTAFEAMETAATAAADGGTGRAACPGTVTGAGEIVSIRLDTGDDSGTCVGAFVVPKAGGGGPGTGDEVEQRLLLAADLPAAYRSRLVLRRAVTDVENYSAGLELALALNNDKKFLGAAMTFCNELAGRLQCDRVSLGWLEKNRYVRLRAISHTEKFDRKMDAVQMLEAAMEEAVDQDDEILWPQPEGATQITRDHEAYATTQSVERLASAPLRVDGEPAGVVTCERPGAPLTDPQVRLLRLGCDVASRRLSDLKRADRWFGARWWTAAREGLGRLVGVEHTWAKALAIGIAVAVGVLLFGRMDYRVEAPFQLHTDRVGYVPAPFEGFIAEVNARVGDEVAAGDVLLTLDTRDLFLEEAAAAADQTRYARETEKARADGDLAQMRISEALAAQSRARLDLVRFRLEQAAIRAPFEGVVVDGDLRERIGSPVEQGNVLFRLARLEDLYVRARVDEADIHEVADGAPGRIAFASRPNLRYPVRVERVDPVAEASEEGNVFTVRAAIDGSAEAWWRPGMSGVVKIDAGRRNIAWVFTHRTIDFLRLRLWW